MPTPTIDVFSPRKTPVQARSTASVEAILEATVQVLLSVGQEELTTTKVAHRAGVSVGTLYQYFPNKKALLQEVLTRHLDGVTKAVERVCREQRGQPLQVMATALIEGFLQAKMQSVATSAALYAVASDVDAARIVKTKGTRSLKAIAGMLESSCDAMTREPQRAAEMLYGAMVGVSRGLLESPAPGKIVAGVREELMFFACSYLEACRA
ncbi:transcriptional regulator, TetR family [Granulicella pectinivorans]|uniref:Transcriptional regulator, TetR family n=1 Tax=Granulicella pectinivorans TaxID=474950 RepID=A0A1I6MA24_9BACT|nr:TetR/AcrR family transcriptional regulator [Granulicella pectinivorans]SFS12497.1 transcriptional regulator, TetR family [Granulicella pectinivorans]